MQYEYKGRERPYIPDNSRPDIKKPRSSNIGAMVKENE